MDIETFIDGFETAALAHDVRAFVKKHEPDAVETLHAGWKVISYGHGKKFCAIAPHKQWVNLQFHSGGRLDDPKGLLQGTGKSMRHVKIEKKKDLSADLKELLKAAAKDAT